jgi:(p)ppGpp synthase/HD superfamily hydrolase
MNTLKLTEHQERLFDFVKEKHKEQKRKYTGEPYHNHVYSVAELVSQHETDCIEIALCHDLLEDTDCNVMELYRKLRNIGYTTQFSRTVCECVVELTDVFTHEDYPTLNRGERKRLESERLSNISYLSQSVKYADLIDNTSSIAEHDEGFARVYLKEKRSILEGMSEGNQTLYNRCKEVLSNAENKVW